MNQNLLLPTDGYTFETFCCHMARERYQDNDARKYGRSGQKQGGIDIKATDRVSGSNKRVVIQCKYKEPNQRISSAKIEKEIEKEFDQALKEHKFERFIYASNIKLDAKLDSFAEELGDKFGKEVFIWCQDDIIKDIEYFPRLTRIYTRGNAKFGVTVINQDFIDELLNKDVSETGVFRFYSGYSGNNEQWYGILNNFDAPRRQAPTIKERIKFLMTKSVLENKVAAVVYGVGGSGKSTLLRRIAIDLVQGEEEYVNWWVEDIDAFLDFDANTISQWRQQKHLIFIDDWYRNVSLAQCKAFFIWLRKQSNALVIIGDRTNIGNYKDHLYDGYCEFLKPSDNAVILEHVFSKKALGKSKTFEPVIDEIRSQPMLLESVSISMILFVVAWKYNDQTSNDLFSIKEGFENTFKSIVYGLLKKLEADKYYKGLGKALWLAAKIYAHPNLNYFTLKESTLLKIAESIGKNTDLSERVSINNSYPSQMDYLVHSNKINVYNGIELKRVYFNHDVIAEKGIALINDDDLILDKFECVSLLDTFITKECYDEALLLWRFLAAEDGNRTTERNFCKLLKIAKIKSTFSSSGLWGEILRHQLLTEQKKKVCIIIIESPKFYRLPSDIVSIALSVLANKEEGIEAAKTLLALPNFYQLPTDIVSIALTVLENKEEGIDAAKVLLAFPHFYQLPHQIISKALMLLRDKKEGLEASKVLLSLPDFYQLPKEIVSNALTLLHGKEEGIDAAKILLSLPKFYQFPPQIISNAFTLLQGEDEGIEAANILLALPEFYLLSHQVVSRALVLAKGTKEGIKAVNSILSVPNLHQLSHQVVSSALALLEGRKEGINIAKKILNLSDFYQLSPQIISRVLVLLEGTDEGLGAAKMILGSPNFNQFPPDMVSRALTLLEEADEGVKEAKSILNLHNFYLLPHQIITGVLRLLKGLEEGEEIARNLIKKGITKQTFLLFNAIKVLCTSTCKDDIELVESIYLDIRKSKKEKYAPNGVLRLNHDLLWLPLMHIEAHKNYVFGMFKYYEVTNSSKVKTNIYKVLKCYLDEHREKNKWPVFFNNVKKQILLCCEEDIKYQLKCNNHQLQLNHIDIAFKYSQDNQIKYQKAKNIIRIAEEFPIIKNCSLYNTIQEYLNEYVVDNAFESNRV